MGFNLKETGENAGGDFEVLPLDRYNLRVEEAQLKKATTGNDMIATTFVITEGDFKNRKLWNNFTLTPKAMVFLYNFLKAGKSDLIDKEDVETDEILKAMVGLEVSAYAEPGLTPAGNPKNTLSKWQAIEGSSSSSLLE